MNELTLNHFLESIYPCMHQSIDRPISLQMNQTDYECKGSIFVPQFAVSDAHGAAVYLIRPDTCLCGTCPRVSCFGRGGKRTFNRSTNEKSLESSSSHYMTIPAQIDCATF